MAQVANRLAAAVGLRPIVATASRAADLPVRGRAPAQHRPPVAGSRGLRRLHAALRIGTALHVGGVRPIGGGVFIGGHLIRDVLAGRGRAQALVATAALLAVIGLTWSATRDPEDAGPAQAAAAAGAAPVAAIPHSSECQVRYQVRRDSGSDFEALLTMSNVGVRILTGWRLEFAYPGTQRLTGAPKRVAQTGRKVVVSGKAGGMLSPGRSVTVTLRGGYRNANPLPLAFRLDGHPCESVVIGATTKITKPSSSASRFAGFSCASVAPEV